MSTMKTVYPGMQQSGSGQPQGGAPEVNQKINSQARPLMGFLFSVSKTACGEYWPLYVGPNTIGRGADCSVVLNEATVSDAHATLVIRKMQNNGQNSGVFVFVQDTASTCGTMLNGVTLDFNPKECKNGDIITIGESYELYFMLVDAESLGLAEKDNFQEVKDESQGNAGWVVQSPVQKGTIPGNGSSPFDDGRKPTIYMPTK